MLILSLVFPLHSSTYSVLFSMMICRGGMYLCWRWLGKKWLFSYRELTRNSDRWESTQNEEFLRSHRYSVHHSASPFLWSVHTSELVGRHKRLGNDWSSRENFSSFSSSSWTTIFSYANSPFLHFIQSLPSSSFFPLLSPSPIHPLFRGYHKWRGLQIRGPSFYSSPWEK